MTNATNISIGNTIDLSHMYGARAYQVEVTFTMDGLTFRAQRFVRSAATGFKCNNVDLYVKHASAWADDYQGRIAGSDVTVKASRVTRKALELLAVAEADIPADMSARYAMIELA